MNIEEADGLNTDNILKMLEQYRNPGIVQINKAETSPGNVASEFSAVGISASSSVVIESHLGQRVNIWA